MRKAKFPFASSSYNEYGGQLRPPENRISLHVTVQPSPSLLRLHILPAKTQGRLIFSTCPEASYSSCIP